MYGILYRRKDTTQIVNTKILHYFYNHIGESVNTKKMKKFTM